MTTKTELLHWFVEHKTKGYKYMIIMCDTFDNSDYPIGCKNDKECLKRLDEKNEMERVMEVYNLEMDMLSQLQETYCDNRPKRK